MASTYSSNLNIELISTGENSGTWGNITNTNLGTALEQAVIGLGNPDYTSDANLTITITDTNAAQAARALVLNVTSTFGSLTATRELIVPTIQKQYIVQNNTTGGQSITVKTSAGTGITVPNGRKAHLYVNGTNVIQMFDFINVLGGTIDNTTLGATTASSARVTTLNASGAATLDGNVALGNAVGDVITVPGTIGSNLIFTDNLYDIGASGATRPRNLFLAGAATVGGNLSVGGTLTLTGGVNLNGNVTVGDASTDTLTINSTITSNLIFTDNTYDIGASGATRPRSLFLSGNITAGGNQTLTGALTVDSTTDSSSTTTGSIQTDGGLGVAKALFVGTTANIAGVATFSAGTVSLPAITTTGDTNTGIYFPAADTIAFTEGGAESMRIDSSGNLGLGVTPGAYSENSKFTINGTGKTNGIYINFNGTGADKQILLTNGGSANCFVGTDNTAMTLGTGNTERARIDSSGRFGVGLTPTANTYLIQSNSGVRAGTSVVAQGTLQGYTGAGIFMSYESTYGRIESYDYGASAWKDIAIAQNGGNVGIGITPSYKLDVNGTTFLRSTTNIYSSTGGAVNSSFLTFGSAALLAAASIYGKTDTSTAGNLVFATAQSGTGTMTERGRFDSGGYFGIGTSSPAVKLDVAGGSSADVIQIRGRTSDNFGLLSFATSAGVKGAYLGSSDSTNLIFYTNGFTERARIDSSGNVAIGVTTAATLLTLQKSAGEMFRAIVSSNTNLYTSIGADGNGGWINGSTNLVFQTGGTERMRIDSSGNVGIGTSSPASRLTNQSTNLADANGLSSGAQAIQWQGTGQGYVATFYNSGNGSQYANGLLVRTTGTSNDADAIVSFESGGTSRFRVTGAGNVGIGLGASVPRTLLDFKQQNTAQIITLGESSNPLVRSGFGLNNSNAAIRYYSIDGHLFGKVSSSDGSTWTEWMRLDASGSLLLGGTTAAASTGGMTITVGAGGSVSTPLALRNPGTANGSGVQMSFRGSTNGGAEYDYAYIGMIASNTSNGQGTVTFSTSNNGSPSERMRLNNEGQLQVGLNNTGQTGQIQSKGLARTSGTNVFWPITISAGETFDTGGYTSMIGLGVEGHAWSKGAIGYTRTGAYDTGYIGFYLNATADVSTCTLANEKVRITNDGNVAIGNTSIPDTPKLGAQQVNASFPALVAYCSSGSFVAQVIQARASRNTTNSTFKAFNYYNDGSNNDRFTVQDSGNVQNVNNSYGALSDVKLKENISDATPKLADLMQVRIRNYTLKSDPSHKQLGVVAQELESVFPSMVEDSTDTDAEGNDLGTKTKAVKYSVFVPMLIKAMQEQQVIIESLKARLDAANL